jgi:hypothetical protein
MADSGSDRDAVLRRPLPTVEELTAEQRATYEYLRALSRESAESKLPGATSDHSDMYDEFGPA